MEHVEACNCVYNFRELQLRGKRCSDVVTLFLNPLNGSFYPDARRAGTLDQGGAEARPFSFVQNSALGFYVKKGEAVVEFSRDMHSGCYALSSASKGGGILQGACQTSAQSVKLCQCPDGLEKNTDSYNQALKEFSDSLSLDQLNMRRALGRSPEKVFTAQ